MTNKQTYDFLNNLLMEMKFKNTRDMKEYLIKFHKEEWDNNEEMRRWIYEM